MDNTLMRELFLQRLPGNVRMVLASTPDTVDLASLAELADKVVEVAAPAVAAVQAPSLSTDVEQLRSEVTRLQGLVKALSTTRSHPASPRRRLSRSPTPVRLSPDALCWYHQKFGDAATKCRRPCAMALNDEATR